MEAIAHKLYPNNKTQFHFELKEKWNTLEKVRDYEKEQQEKVRKKNAELYHYRSETVRLKKEAIINANK